MSKINICTENLKKFGVLMGIALFVISTLIYIKNKEVVLWLPIISLLFFLFSILKPAVLKPPYFIWMKIAYLLSWVNTRIILSVIFYFIFAPVGLVMRLFRADPLDRRIEKNSHSYWKIKKKKEFNCLDYERQF